MLQLDTFLAWIEVDRISAPEYLSSVSPDGKRASCWIQSQEGKRFTVKWKNSLPEEHVKAVLVLDGVEIPLTSSSTTRSDGKEAVTAGCSHAFVSPYEMRPFMFKGTKTSSASVPPMTYAELMRVATPIEIRLELWIGKEGGIKPLKYAPPLVELDRPAVLGDCHLHRVSLGETRFVCGHMTEKSYDRKFKLVTFTFKYRPLRYLLDNGINPALPRLEEPSSPASESLTAGLSALAYTPRKRSRELGPPAPPPPEYLVSFKRAKTGTI